MTSADPTHDPVNRSTGSDPTPVNGQPGHGSTRTSQRVNRPGQRFNGPARSTVNRVRPDPVNGQPGHGSTRTGQRVNGSTRSTVKRVNRVKPDPVNTAKPYTRAATRRPTRRPFWWRVRAREREFPGNFGTYRFVSKFPTMWYIDLPCLKLLKT